MFFRVTVVVINYYRQWSSIFKFILMDSVVLHNISSHGGILQLLLHFRELITDLVLLKMHVML